MNGFTMLVVPSSPPGRSTDLEPSRDTVPGYPLAGKLWQATATVQAVRGAVTPIIPNLNARSNNGQNYQVLWQAFTPNGISRATIAQGTKSSRQDLLRRHGPNTCQGRLQQRSPRSPHLGKITPPPHRLSLL